MKKGSASAAGRCGKWLLPALAALTAAGWLGNSAIVTREYTITSRRLPEAFSGMRIVQISDLHGKRFGKDDARLLRAVRQARPDLIALTGDFADELTELSALEPLLEGLKALAPVFYVTGNHEWVMDGAQRRELFALLDGCGVVRLRNSWRVLKSGGCRIVLAGVNDPNGPADQKTPEALVAEIRAAEGGDAFILMLAHRNDQLARWAALGVDAVLAGHAHGGIVRLPGIGPVFGTHYEFFPEFTSGLYTQDGTQLLVSRGLGASHRLPLRIGNPPELPVLILRAERPEA